MTLPTHYAIRNTQSTEVARRIQGYLHRKARVGREALIVGGFTLYLHGGEAGSGVSLVLPNRPACDLHPSVLERMEGIFARRGQIVCFQLLDSFAPGLVETLSGLGYGVQECLPALVCLPGQVVKPPAPAEVPTQPPHPSPPQIGEGTGSTPPPIWGRLGGGDLLPAELEMVTVSSDSSPEDVAENWNINARGFDPSATLAQSSDVLDFRRSLDKSRAFTARLDGLGVCAGMYTDIVEGVTELVGIATLHAYRRRGIGGALTVYATQTAFADGASLVFLTAANEGAGRVYQRVGFRPLGNQLLLAKKI